MKGSLSLATAPTVEPVSLPEVKLHLRVDITDDDAYIAGLLQAVRTAFERQYGTAFVTQTWDWYLDDFPGTAFELPIWPVSSLTSIKYTDEDDSESTYSNTNYRVDTVSKPARVILKTGSSWPTVTLKEHNGVVICFVAGYGVASAVPEPIKQAIKIAVSDLYEQREDILTGTISIDFKVAEKLMTNYRSWNF